MARETSWNWSGVALILIGLVFLLSTLDIVQLHDLARFWPVILIAIGVRMVIQHRQADSKPDSEPPPPPPAS